LVPSGKATPRRVASVLNDRGILERLKLEGIKYYDEEGGYHLEGFEYLPPWLIARFLHPPLESNAAQGELGERLPELLELMEDEIVVEGSGADPTIAVRLHEHAALTCLAAEAQVKHELEADDLIEYLVDLVLTTESDV
jgi:hypothetical protein